jgi:hypothetical protein
LTALDRVQSALAPLSARDHEVALWRQLLSCMRGHAQYVFGHDPKGSIAAGNNARDAQMAANLLWLARDPYPTKKIIVWAATMHNMRHPERVDPRYSEYGNRHRTTFPGRRTAAWRIWSPPRSTISQLSTFGTCRGAVTGCASQ